MRLGSLNSRMSDNGRGIKEDHGAGSDDGYSIGEEASSGSADSVGAGGGGGGGSIGSGFLN